MATQKSSLTAITPHLISEWHSTKNVGINPGQIAAGSNKKVWWKCPKGVDHEWQASPNKRKSGRGCPFCAGKRVSVTNSLGSLHPDLAQQWHETKNGILTPDKITAGSNKKVWWKCSEGPDHEWQASVSNRVKGRGCPFCAGRRVSVTNSLASLYPEIAIEWHPTKNGDLTPKDVVSGSSQKIWWKCSEGPDHEWQAPVINRRSSPGCPFCRGLRASITNSLASLYPEIANQWHPTKNGNLTPDNVTWGSSKKAWWKCSNGPDHEWQEIISNRTRQGHGCPACSGRLASVTNSVAQLFPQLAKEWHPIKNGDLTPEQIPSGSHKKVWWKCPEGADHEWLQSPGVRTRMETGCPCCQGLQVSITNSLATQYPRLAKQWHPERNGNLKPENIVAFSNKKVWWVCPKGLDHEWQAAPSTRITQNQGCPFCAGKQVSITNSLASLYPRLVQEWHPTKNGNITPDMVTAGSGKKYWWVCLEGPDHEWQAPVNARTSGFGCPYCRGFEVSVTNSLAILYPEIAEEWHPTKNGSITPDKVVIGSGKTYWWQCSIDKTHEWQAQVYSRTKMDTGCPICIDMVNGARVSQVQRDLCDMLNGELNQPLDNYNIDVAIKRAGINIAVEYDAWYWHGGREEYDSQRDAKIIEYGWRVLRIKSNKKLPTVSQINNAISFLLKGKTYTEIVLDDWGDGPTKTDLS